MKKVVNIDWDIDKEDGYDEEEIVLPSSMDVPDGIPDDQIADYLSNQTGFCVRSFFVLAKGDQQNEGD